MPRESFVLDKNVVLDGGGVSWDFADLMATSLAMRQGAIVATASDWVIENFSIAGAGIREAAHTLVSGIRIASTCWGTIANCHLQRCQNGIGGSVFNWVLMIRDCMLTNNGLGDGFTNNCYVNSGNRVTFVNTRSESANRGHAIKSRAWHTILENCVMTQSDAVNLDVAEGGILRVRSSTFNKPAGSATASFLNYATEGTQRGLPGGIITQSRM